MRKSINDEGHTTLTESDDEHKCELEGCNNFPAPVRFEPYDKAKGVHYFCCLSHEEKWEKKRFQEKPNKAKKK